MRKSSDITIDQSMNTSQIYQALARDNYIKTIYFGVFPADRLPTKPPIPCAIVANTAPSSSSGEHWVCFFIDDKQNGNWFDSYGFPPEFYSARFRTFLMENTVNFEYSQVQLQEISSTVCGAYCLYFLSCRSRHIGYDKTLSVFTQDSARNDNLIKQFVARQFNLHIPIRDEFFTNQVARAMKHILKMYH